MTSLPTEFEGSVRIAIIGGIGLTSLPHFTPIAQLPLTHPALSTPWGHPSSPITILSHPRHGSTQPFPASSTTPAATTPLNVAFLSRHGLNHEHAPHQVPSRANIAALRKLGVRCILAFSAVGSLEESIRPRDFVLPDQAIDRTKGIRPFTFFEDGVVVHVPFADPFDNELRDVIVAAVAEEPDVMAETPSEPVNVTVPPRFNSRGLLVCMEGPQFSTRAESHLYRSWGASVINIVVVARGEAGEGGGDRAEEGGDGDVSVKMVMANMSANAGNARKITAAVLDVLGMGIDGERREGVGTESGVYDLEKIRRVVNGEKWSGQSRRGLAGLSTDSQVKHEANARLKWLFEDWKTDS